jgi:hypothetical protein
MQKHLEYHQWSLVIIGRRHTRKGIIPVWISWCIRNASNVEAVGSSEKGYQSISKVFSTPSIWNLPFPLIVTTGVFEFEIVGAAANTPHPLRKRHAIVKNMDMLS